MLLAMMPDIYFVPYFIIGFRIRPCRDDNWPRLASNSSQPDLIKADFRPIFGYWSRFWGKKKPNWGRVDVTPPPLPVSKYFYILTLVLNKIYLLPNIFIVILKKYILSLYCYHYTKISLYI